MSQAKLQGSYALATTQRFTAAAAQVDGDVIEDQQRYGVCYNDVVSGKEGLMIVGTDGKGILMPKAAVTIVKNTKAYMIDATKLVTNVATANVFIGYFVAAAASGDAEAVVQLTQA